MKRIKGLRLAVAIALVWCVGSTAQAQLTEFTWTAGSGSGLLWQQDGNWDEANFPNDPEHVANLAVDLPGNLSVDLGSTGNDVTIAGLNIGGTAGAVTTDITSSGALLKLQNDFVEDLADADFSNNGTVDGEDFLIWQRGFGETNQENNFMGDADESGTVDSLDLDIWDENYGLNNTGLNGGRPVITTGGSAGTVNRVSAPVRIVNSIDPNNMDDDSGIPNVSVMGTADLIIDGALTFENANPVAEVQDASLSNTSAGITTTINGPINLNNQIGGTGGVFGLNVAQGSQGTLIVNGVISDVGTNADLNIGVQQSGARFPLSTVRLTANNTNDGGVRVGRVNLELAHDNALGFDPSADNGMGGMGVWSPLRQSGPSNQFGYNIIPVGGDRNLGNDFTMAQWQTFRGEHSVTLSGDITQTNNRGFINLLNAGETLTLSGRLDIWEDDEALERRFVFDGTGKTIINGIVRGDPSASGENRQIVKTGTGALVIDVGSGDNNHSGDTIVRMGNFHYANNASLNQGNGNIVSTGGAVGVDAHPSGQTLASNSTFLNKISTSSVGGLMLAPTDANTNLNFTTGALARAANMTVAAPETGITYTGTITPANSTYGLGGGTGTLTLPNAQLSGSNSVEIRNGGTVELLGNNTYTGSTTIVTKYTSSNEERAAANSSNGNIFDREALEDFLGGTFERESTESLFYDRFVAPTLVVDDLANGGSASGIGAASSDAANLLIQGSTLKYVGAGDTTNRLFTIGTGGATLDSSGIGAVVFSNTGALGRDDAEDKTGSINNFANLAGRPKQDGVVYIATTEDTSDIVVGMSVSDPDAGNVFGSGGTCDPDGSNCIPDNVVVTGVSDEGFTIGLSEGFGFIGEDEDPVAAEIAKLDTRIVFGTVERTLTLAGSNADNNELASVIGDSPMGGVVAVEKTGAGKWILSGANTYTGDTTVGEGILSLTSAFLDDDAAVNIDTGGILDLDTSGATDVVESLLLNGTEQEAGLWGAIGNGAATFTTALITGSGLLNVGGAALANLTSVPEPSTLVLAGLAVMGMGGRRRKVSA